jgi:hypothetical protein
VSERIEAARLAEIRERVEAATAGPWRHGTNPRFEDGPDWSWGATGTVATHESFGRPLETRVLSAEDPPENEADLDFIAHAREDVPYLLALVESYAPLVAAARTVIEHARALAWNPLMPMAELEAHFEAFDGALAEWDRLRAALEQVEDKG